MVIEERDLEKRHSHVAYKINSYSLESNEK